MTLNQLQTLNEDEIAMALFVVNNIFPTLPPMEYSPRNLTWIKHDILIKKLTDAFPKVKPEAHPIFASLMEKLGVKVTIEKVDPPALPITASTENTGSMSTTPTPTG